MNHRKLATLATLSIISFGGLSLQANAQQGKTLNEQESKKVEALNSEIKQLTQQLQAITGELDNIEPGDDTQLIIEEIEEVKELAADIIDTAKEVDEDIKVWSGSLEFGYANSSGNTEETNIKGRADIKREQDEWRYSLFFDSLNSESDGVRTAGKYFLSNRLAYHFSEENYTFFYASYDDDRFNGYDYQATASLGYGRRILNDDTMWWDIDIGPGYRYSEKESELGGDVSEESIIRLFSEYSWDFSEHASFSQVLSREAGKDNTISRSITSLRTKVIGALFLKLSYTVKYNSTVPADTQNADKETAVTVAYSF